MDSYASPLPPLSKSLIRNHATTLDPHSIVDKDFPIRVIQFGEGGFLRGFADWMIQRMNTQGLFQGKVIVVQPIPSGTIEILNKQEGCYTLLKRGLDQGNPMEVREVITSIDSGIDPYTEYQRFLDCASLPDLRFIISNTTEAGIVLDEEDRFDAMPPRSFPGKLTRFLWERYKQVQGRLDKGFILLPCELIDRNGDTLKKIVCLLAERWIKDAKFLAWIDEANIFCNTLVDGIMTGYPKDEIDSLQEMVGYRDELFDTGELFHLWVIEGPEGVRREFPLDRAGLNVIWASDMTPYRTRKVRILNGVHTMTAPAALLSGIETVRQAVQDPVFSQFIRRGIYTEIFPVLSLPQTELEVFAESVLERFANPFIKHLWSSISLNSLAKFRARVLPTILEYRARFNRPPTLLCWAFAALLAYYRGLILPEKAHQIQDDARVLDLLRSLWTEQQNNPGSTMYKLVQRVCTDSALWGESLSDPMPIAEVAKHLYRIIERGSYSSLQQILQESDR